MLLLLAMGTFSSLQLEKLADISGNIAVAWFAAGVIAPLFIRPQNISEFLSPFMAALTLTLFFIIISLKLIEKVESL